MANIIDCERIITALGGKRGSNCFCPAHDNKSTPALSVNLRSGKILVHCHRGCDQQSVIDALRGKGLWPDNNDREVAIDRARHMDEAQSERHDEHQRFKHGIAILRAALQAQAGLPEAYLKGRGINQLPAGAMLLPARDARTQIGRAYPAMVMPIVQPAIKDGADSDHFELMGAHVTWLSKNGSVKLNSGKQRQMFGPIRGGFVQLGEIDPDGSLIVAEGIETALAASQIAGLPAIAAMSSGNMKAVEVPPCAKVIIAADHDDAGLKAAEELAERLRYTGRKVLIVVPPAEGEDWNDRLLSSRTPLQEWETALDHADEPVFDLGPISALEEEKFMALAFPKPQLILEPWLPAPGLLMIHAARGQGKTWFALSVAKAVAAKADLLGWTCQRYARVLYVDGELPGAKLQERLDRFERSPPGLFHVLCRDTFLLRRQPMPDLGTKEGREVLNDMIDGCQPDLIIFDSLSTLVRTGVENEAESWAPIQDWMLAHRWKGRTIIMIHHEGRSGKPRGTSKREDVMDTMIGLKMVEREGDELDGESVFELQFTKHRDFFGAAAEPMLIRLSMRDGKVIWNHERVKDARREKALKLRQTGMKQKDIAKELKISEGRVSQVLKDADRNTGDKVVRLRPRKDEDVSPL